MPGRPEISEAREKIRAWVADTQWRLIEEVRSDELHWGFICRQTANNPIALVVAQSARSEDVIELSFNLSGHPDDLDRMRRFTKEKKRLLSSDIFVALAPTSIGLRFESENEVPVRQLLFHRIAYDGLTKDRFLTAVQSIANAVSTVVAIQNRYLDAAPPSLTN